MLLGLMFSAISGGATGLLVSLMHGFSLPHVLLSYPLGGVLAIALFVTLTASRRAGADF